MTKKNVSVSFFQFCFWSIFWSIVEKPIVHPKLLHSLPLFVGVLLLRLPQPPLRPREFQLRLSSIGISLIPKFRSEKICYLCTLQCKSNLTNLLPLFVGVLLLLPQIPRRLRDVQLFLSSIGISPFSICSISWKRLH